MQKLPQGRLIALRAPSPIDPKVDPPSRLVMLKWGDNPTTKGNFRVGKKTLESLAANQHRAGFDEVVLDFEHNTVPNHPANRGEPAAIAARGKPIVVEKEGLIFDSLSWTEPGIQFREHYHDLSPVVAKDENDDVVFVHSGCICRNGATYELHAFNAQIDLKTFSLTPFSDPASKIQTLPVNASAVDIDLLKRVLNLSTLSADASIEDINRALQEVELGSNAALNSAIRNFGLELATLSVDLKTLRTGLQTSERNQILTEALSTGKIVPKEWLPDANGQGGLPIAQLRSLISTLPEIVPLGKRTPENLVELSSFRQGNREEEEVRQRLGISEEQWKKHNAA